MIPRRYEKAKYEEVPKPIIEAFEKMHETRKGIYIHGAVGSGKTHIAYALKKQWDERAPRGAIFWNTTELIREIKMDFDRDAYSKRRPEERIMEEDRTLLFLDDLGAERMTDFVQETFYVIINHRYNKMVPVVITSNLSIDELAERVGDRTASRIAEMCEIINLTGDDRRVK